MTGAPEASASQAESRRGVEEFRRVFEAAPFACGILDVDGVILSANLALQRTVGHAAESLVGRRVIELIPREERRHVEDGIRGLTSGRTDSLITSHHFVRPDGREILVEASSGAVRDAEGNLLCIVSQVLDVTARRDAERVMRAMEQRYRAVFEHSPIPMWIVDAETLEFIDANLAMVSKYGWSRAQLRGMTIRDLQPPGQAAAVERAARAAAESDIIVTPHRHRTHDGTLIDVELVARPIDFGGRSARLVVAQDVTARLLAERAAEEARETAARGERLSALGSLMSGVAHEIRTPLACVANALSIMETRLARGFANQADASDAAVALADARESVDRINGLVRSMRLAAQPAPARRARTNLAQTVLDAVRQFEQATGRAIKAITEAGRAVEVDADAGEIARVIHNLLQNAIDADPSGRVRIWASAEDGFGVILVEDEGPGIAFELQPKIFEPYYTTKPDGLGLGLSIVRRIVEQHGGRIWVTSYEGRGSSFRVSLPLASRRVPVEAPAAPAPATLTTPQESS